MTTAAVPVPVPAIADTMSKTSANHRAVHQRVGVAQPDFDDVGAASHIVHRP
jgi:hypothetical protein